MARWDEKSKVMKTSIDDSKPEGRRLVSRCLAGADMKIRNAAGRRHRMVHFFAHVVLLQPKAEGELPTPKIRAVIVLDDGKTISTMSGPCIDGLAYIVNRAGPGPYDPPIEIEIKEVPMTAEQSYCVLFEAEPEEKKVTKNRKETQA